MDFFEQLEQQQWTKKQVSTSENTCVNGNLDEHKHVNKIFIRKLSKEPGLPYADILDTISGYRQKNTGFPGPVRVLT